MTGAKGVQSIESMSTVDLAERALQVNNHIRAGAARVGWQSRYALTLYVIDFAVGLCAAILALILRFGSSGVEPFMRDYLLVTVILPIAWIACLAVNRANEPRHLFVGTEEYARVFRSGLALTAA